MLIATFNSATGWAGKTITYDAGVFTLEGHGAISAEQVLSYDASGQIEWQYDGLRAWVHSQAGGGAAAQPEKKGTSTLLMTLVTVGIGIIVLIVVLAVAASMNESVGTADQNYQGAQDALDDASSSTSMVAVFTWSGGGPSNDIRNSEPFQLEGGHQVFAYTSAPVAGEYVDPSLGWAVLVADGSGGGEMVNPASVSSGQSDLYLPFGSYYISSNTLDCTWTVTITEER